MLARRWGPEHGNEPDVTRKGGEMIELTRGMAGLVVCSRGDGTGFFTPETSRAKALAAANFRMSTADLADRVQKGGAFWAHVGSAIPGQILASHGAVRIVVGGRVIGAIGCGGGTGEQDQECAAAGAAVLA